jgi:succinoglycan biosynthesis protein ExoM
MLPKDFALEIVIVDNDAFKSGESIFKEFKNSDNIFLYYFAQPIKNISLTRNMTVEKASGEYILFIDDDEVASHEWVYNLVTTVESYNADGVFGPVMPQYNSQTPEWIRCRELFYDPLQETGEQAQAKYTSNALIKKTLLKQTEGPFDPRYGLSGGEDTHLFDRLQKQGARFVYCREAWVSEYLPPERTRLSYLFKRGFRGGNIHTRRIIEFASNHRVWLRLFMVAKSILFGTISMVLLVSPLPNSIKRMHWLMKLASNLGRFIAAFGLSYKGY